MTAVNPVGDIVFVLVEPEATEQKSAGGLFVPPSEDGPIVGMVLAVGPGLRASQSGILIPTDIEVGSRVLVPRHQNAEAVIDGRKYLILRASEVIATVSK